MRSTARSTRTACHGEAMLRVMAKPCFASWRSHASHHGEAMPRMDSSQIITIFELPAPSIASALPARFQMLYRKA